MNTKQIADGLVAGFYASVALIAKEQGHDDGCYIVYGEDCDCSLSKTRDK